MKLRPIIVEEKKGAIVDIIIWVIFAFVIVMFFGIYYYGHGLLKDRLISITAPVGNGTTNVSAIAIDTFGQVHTGLGVLKTLAWVMIVGMILTIFIGNFLVRVHPVFFVVYLAFVILAFILSVYVSNSYEDFLLNADFGSTLEGFTGGSFILLYLPVWVTIIGFVGMVLLMIGIQRDREYGGIV